MLGLLLGPHSVLPLWGIPMIEGQLWQPRVIEQIRHPREMNNANKPQVYWELWPKQVPAYFLDAKGKTHGLSASSRAGANRNRTMPLMSIMCDPLDLILISSSRQTKHGAAVGSTLLETYFFFYIPANLE